MNRIIGIIIALCLSCIATTSCYACDDNDIIAGHVIPESKQYPLEKGYSLPYRSVAMIADSNANPFVSSLRPQRILPFGSSMQGKTNPLLLNRHFSTLNIFHGTNLRYEAAPFVSAASCDYYVFALRRLRC